MGPSFGRDLTVSTAFSNFSFDMMVDTDTRTMVKSMAMAMAICGAVRCGPTAAPLWLGQVEGRLGLVPFSGPPRPDTGDLTFLPPYPTILSEAHGPTFGDPPIPLT